MEVRKNNRQQAVAVLRRSFLPNISDLKSMTSTESGMKEHKEKWSVMKRKCVKDRARDQDFTVFLFQKCRCFPRFALLCSQGLKNRKLLATTPSAMMVACCCTMMWCEVFGVFVRFFFCDTRSQQLCCCVVVLFVVVMCCQSFVCSAVTILFAATILDSFAF